MDDPVTALLEDVCGGLGPREGIYAEEAVFDATVPGWRFQQHGQAAVRRQLAGWYDHPGQFEELSRVPVPGGEVVTFTLTWREDDGRRWTHQAHVLEVQDGRIVRQQAWCGGRWSEQRMAEMAADSA